MQIWTANDFTKRDPINYKLYGTNTNFTGGTIKLAEFTLIANGALTLPLSRNSGGSSPLLEQNSTTVDISDSTSYQTYLIFFPQVRQVDVNPPLYQENAMQIAEIQFYGFVPPQKVEALPLMLPWQRWFFALMGILLSLSLTGILDKETIMGANKT